MAGQTTGETLPPLYLVTTEMTEAIVIQGVWDMLDSWTAGQLGSLFQYTTAFQFTLVVSHMLGLYLHPMFM